MDNLGSFDGDVIYGQRLTCRTCVSLINLLLYSPRRLQNFPERSYKNLIHISVIISYILILLLPKLRFFL